MAQISIIKKKDVLKTGRFDAEYFDPKFLRIELKLSKIRTEQLRNICEFKNNKRIPIEKSLRINGDYPYYGAQGINGYIDKYILDGDYLLVAEDGENLRSRKKDIAFSVGGKFWVNNHAHVLEFKDVKLKNITELFLNLFPLRSVSGVAQPKLSKENLGNIKIPIFSDKFQIEIEKLMSGMNRKMEKVKQLYKDAEWILLEELDLVGYESKHTLAFEVKRKDVESVGRFDAEYFQPKYRNIIKKIEGYKGGFDSLKNMVKWKKGIEVGSDSYLETGKKFVRVSDFSEHGIGKTNKYISRDLFERLGDESHPQKGEILFTKDGTVGISHVLKEDIDGILSSAFLRVWLKKEYQKFESECLSLFFNSAMCKAQIERLSGGAIINHLKPSDFEKFKIPLIKKKVQSQIAEKIQESYKLRKESKELLESAKKKVEEKNRKSMKKEIYGVIGSALRGVGVSEGVRFSVERSDSPEHGDYASNVAMVVAKQSGRKPYDVAEELKEKIAGSISAVDRIEIAGPGFLNFYLSRDFFSEKIADIHRLGERWGGNAAEAGKEVLVEYTSPNLFKPLHIGNLVGTIVGESLARIFTMSGADVHRVTYPCDIGLTVAKGVWGLRKIGGDLSDVRLLGEAYRVGSEKYDSDPEAKGEIDAINTLIYEGGDEEVQRLYESGKRASLEHIDALCKMLGTKFDTVIPESDAAPVGKGLVEDHMRDGIFQEDAGAVVFRGEERGLHTRVFLNSRGLPTYEAKELGNFALKQKQYPAWDRSLIVTGSEQKEYFAVLIQAMKEVFPDSEGKTIEHIATGFLTLASGKMSSRKGNVLTGESLLEDLRDEAMKYTKDSRARDGAILAEQIAVAAIKYQILRIKTGSNIVFDKQQAFSFEGDSGPYLQYTYARIRSVLQKANDVGIQSSDEKVPEEVYAVERLVCHFEECIALALEKRSPHYIITYATSLAGAFNAFYADEKIADTSDPFAGYKAMVAQAVGHTLKNALWVLGIPAPEQM